jgi:hypothetical protein
MSQPRLLMLMSGLFVMFLSFLAMVGRLWRHGRLL